MAEGGIYLFSLGLEEHTIIYFYNYSLNLRLLNINQFNHTCLTENFFSYLEEKKVRTVRIQSLQHIVIMIYIQKLKCGIFHA